MRGSQVCSSLPRSRMGSRVSSVRWKGLPSALVRLCCLRLWFSRFSFSPYECYDLGETSTPLVWMVAVRRYLPKFQPLCRCSTHEQWNQTQNKLADCENWRLSEDNVSKCEKLGPGKKVGNPNLRTKCKQKINGKLSEWILYGDTKKSIRTQKDTLKNFKIWKPDPKISELELK